MLISTILVEIYIQGYSNGFFVFHTGTEEEEDPLDSRAAPVPAPSTGALSKEVQKAAF